MPEDVKPAAAEGEPAAAAQASSSEVKKDIGEAAGAVGSAASTATHAGEDVVAGTLSRIEGLLNEIKERLGAPSATNATKTAVKPAEATAEAIVPEVKVTPRKAHWTSGMPKWM
jgi:hypothetical protein